MLFEQDRDGNWIAQGRPGPRRLIGIPFLLMSLFPLGGAMGLFPITTKSGGPAPAAILLPFGLTFTLAGLALMFFRSGLCINQEKGTLTRWRKALIPLGSKTRSFDEFDAVFHHKRVIRSNKSNHTVFPVELEGITGKKNWVIQHCRDYRSARSTAEQLARLLEIAVIDRTDGEERRREFQDIDLSLREQRELGNREPELGEAPQEIRSRLTPHGDELEIRIPPMGFTVLHWVVAAAATGPLWIATIIVSAKATESPPAVLGAGLAFAVAPFLVALTLLVIHARRRWLVLVSPHSLRIETRAIRRRNTVIPACELEELAVSNKRAHNKFLRRLVGGPPIIAISDSTHVEFGTSLSERESRYLTAMIRGIISAPLKSDPTTQSRKSECSDQSP